MLDVAAVQSHLDSLSSPAASWDPVGLQLGERSAPVRRIAICHEVTDEVVDGVAGFDLLVSYHPLFFQPVTHVTDEPGPVGRAYRLIRSGVNLIVVHTAWDAAAGGTADSLGAALGLTDLDDFAGEPLTSSPGVGRIGRFGGDFGELVERSRQVSPTVKVAGSAESPMSVALVPGSGASFVNEAHERGCNVFISGDLSHHAVRWALDRDMAVIDLGHAGSERPGIAALAKALSDLDAEVTELDFDPTPWSRQ